MQVIVLFAGINDIIHGWATSTVLRRFQRFHQHLQQKNPTAKIAIAGILPKRRNRWYAWSKEEEEQLKQENASAKIVNWRLSELSTAIRGLNFISWSEFSESSDHLLARDGLQTSHEGTYIVAKKFRRVSVRFFRMFLKIFSAIILGVRNFRVFEILEHLPYPLFGSFDLDDLKPVNLLIYIFHIEAFMSLCAS